MRFVDFFESCKNKTITRLELSRLSLDGNVYLRDLNPWGDIIDKVVSAEYVILENSMISQATDHLKRLQNSDRTSMFSYINYKGDPFDVCSQFNNLLGLAIEDTYLDYRFNAACGDLEYVKVAISDNEKIRQSEMNTIDYALTLFDGMLSNTLSLDILSPETTIYQMTHLQMDNLAKIFPNVIDLATSICIHDFFIDATNEETFLVEKLKVIQKKNVISQNLKTFKSKFQLQRLEFVFDKSPEKVEEFYFLCSDWSREFDKQKNRLYCQKN